VVAQEGIEEKGTGEEMMIEETKVLLLEGRFVGVAMAEENERGPYRGRHSAMVTSQKRTTDWMVRVREFDPRGWLGRPTVSGGERERVCTTCSLLGGPKGGWVTAARRAYFGVVVVTPDGPAGRCTRRRPVHFCDD